MSDPLPAALSAGWIAPEVQAEFPGLRLRWTAVAARPAPSPPSLRRRLRELSDRYRGGAVVTMRTQPLPRAFRTFFRQIGLDPDVTRVPSEQAAMSRLLHGGFQSTDLIADACLIALIETGVPVWALDAAGVDPLGPGVRTAQPGDGGAAPPGSLLVADGSSVHAVLFGEPAAAHAVSSRTQRVVLFSIGVGGVPEIHLEEALWLAAGMLGASDRDGVTRG